MDSLVSWTLGFVQKHRPASEIGKVDSTMY